MSTYKKLRIAMSVISGIGFIFYMVAFIIPKWSKHNSGHDGIWQMCFMNGGVETCSVWTQKLKTASILTIQIFSCLGLIFYSLFFVMGTLTIFWTNHWKKSKVLKYFTFAFAVLAVVLIATCVAVYHKSSTGDKSLDFGWYFAVIGCFIAGIMSPFYFIDAYRTVPPPKSDKVQFFQNLNVPPKPTRGYFGDKSSDKLSNGGRPPLLSELRKQNTTFVHPPPKTINPTLTMKDIQSFPLPPTKTKLDLFEKSEKDNHPAPINNPLPVATNNKDDDSLQKLAVDQASTASPRSVSRISTNSSVNDTQNHSVFKFHKTKTIKKDGKTLLKIQNENEKLPPVMMIMPGVDENGDDCMNDDDRSTFTTKGQESSQWEQEQARRKFGTYFAGVVGQLYEEKDKTLKENTKKKTKSEIEKEKNINGKIKEVSNVYSHQGIKEIPVVPKQKKQKKRKSKKLQRPISEKSMKGETLVDTYNTEKHDGVTIINDLDEHDEHYVQQAVFTP